MYVLIAGGGKVGFHLARLLTQAGHEAVVIEKDRTRWRELVAQIGESAVLGDASDAGLLKNAGANRADALVACAGADEDNLITCQVAKYLFMTQRTIARVNDPANEELFRMLGVDATVNSTRLIDSLLGLQMGSEGLIPLLSLGKLEFVQAVVREDSALVGKEARSLPLPKGSRISAIMRGTEAIPVEGSEVLAAEDRLVILVPSGASEGVRQALGA